jgi:hypothetical protein
MNVVLGNVSFKDVIMEYYQEAIRLIENASMYETKRQNNIPYKKIHVKIVQMTAVGIKKVAGLDVTDKETLYQLNEALDSQGWNILKSDGKYCLISHDRIKHWPMIGKQ